MDKRSSAEKMKLFLNYHNDPSQIHSLHQRGRHLQVYCTKFSDFGKRYAFLSPISDQGGQVFVTRGSTKDTFFQTVKIGLNFENIIKLFKRNKLGNKLNFNFRTDFST